MQFKLKARYSFGLILATTYIALLVLSAQLVSSRCIDGYPFKCRPKTAFTRCRHILKTVKNVTVAEFELVFTRFLNNLETVGNLTVRNSLQDFDAYKGTYSLKVSISLVS